MTTTSRKYGRKGFTAKKAIRTALEPFERPSRRKHQTTIEGLTSDAAAVLADALPPEQLEDRSTDAAPTMGELIALGVSIGGIRFHGYRVDDDQLDERITLSGFEIPASSVDVETMKAIVDRAADAKVTWVRKGGEALLTVGW